MTTTNATEPSVTPNATPDNLKPKARPRSDTGDRVPLLARATKLGLVLLVLAVGSLIFNRLAALKTPPARVPSEEQTKLEGTMTVRAIEAPRVWEGFGTARAMDAADIPAQVSGQIIERPERIEAGVRVSPGELIVRIDPTDFELAAESARRTLASIEADLGGLEVEESRLAEQVEIAEDEVRLARRDLDRTREAFDVGAGSPAEIDTRVGALRRSERAAISLKERRGLIPSRRARLEAQRSAQLASLAISEKNLERTRITSPITGRLQSIEAETGEWVQTSQIVARVVSLGLLETPLRIPMSAAGLVGVGDPATLRPDGSLDVAWTGRIARIAPEADAGSRSLTVFVEVRQETGDETSLLRPGQFVSGVVEGRSPGERTVIPRRAIRDGRVFIAVPPPPPEDGADSAQEGDTPEGVMIVRSTPAITDYTITGLLPELDPEETDWAVLAPGAGPEPGQTLILTNLDRLSEGTRIRVEPAGDAPEPADESIEPEGEAAP